MQNNQYPHLEKFSKSIGIDPKNLIEAFEIEKNFHNRILSERSLEKRMELYKSVYNAVHPLYDKKIDILPSKKNPKDIIIRLFKKELSGKSILDVGCGEGLFLDCVSKNLHHKELVGIDVSESHLVKNHPVIKFKLKNIINFNLGKKFDVVFSDQVLEHIAPADLQIHLQSVRGSLNPNGVFIINMPNRFFGPSDVTRIIDFTYSGKTPAQGMHLNESTYTELIPILKQAGFSKFKTVCFIPKLKYLMNNYRFSPYFLMKIESNKFILRLLQNLKFRNRCIIPLGITLICE